MEFCVYVCVCAVAKTLLHILKVVAVAELRGLIT